MLGLPEVVFVLVLHFKTEVFGVPVRGRVWSERPSAKVVFLDEAKCRAQIALVKREFGTKWMQPERIVCEAVPLR